MKKNNLDEMQEQELLKIEHNGCWLAFWGMLAVMAIMIWGYFTDPIPLGVLAVLELIPLAVIAGVLLALRQRLREIDGGEEDDAAQY